MELVSDQNARFISQMVQDCLLHYLRLYLRVNCRKRVIEEIELSIRIKSPGK